MRTNQGCLMSTIDLPNHILSSDDFNPENCAQIFERAEWFRTKLDDAAGRAEIRNILQGRLMQSVFYEPSTRTRLSFGSAAQHLGMSVASTENAREFSSAIKGETIQDTIRMLAQYRPDCIVLRHHETGSVREASLVTDVPILNAGDGRGEHPTQALLDAMTVHEKIGKLTDLTILIGGDLAHGRTAKSFAKLTSGWTNNHYIFVTTAGLEMPDEIKDHVLENNCTFEERTDQELDLEGVDVVYWTRIQKERLQPGQNYEQLKAMYQIRPETLESLPALFGRVLKNYYQLLK